jgi:transcriptional regulator with XRE-family HTH domain
MVNHHDVRRHVGGKIRELRTLRGLSQEEFAFECDLDRTYISGIERGARNVSLNNLSTIASALGVPLFRLFTGLPAPNGPSVDAQEVYTVNRSFNIDCGFVVNAKHVTNAAVSTASQLEELPFALFRSIDLKALSGMVGALFATSLADSVGALVNPIEKGHPDIIPTAGGTATEAELRNYPQGLEIKCTVGNVSQGSGLLSGNERVSSLTGITWQAHHREVKSLMGLVVDFSGMLTDTMKHPCITGVFYTDDLVEEDWGTISGTTGRNTKVSGMRVSGKKKMGQGWVIVSANVEHLAKYQELLGFSVD